MFMSDCTQTAIFGRSVAQAGVETRWWGTAARSLACGQCFAELGVCSGMGWGSASVWRVVMRILLKAVFGQHLALILFGRSFAGR